MASAKGLSFTQKDALMRSVEAAYNAGWDGKEGSENEPTIYRGGKRHYRYNTRIGASTPTCEALCARGYADYVPGAETIKLTAKGIAEGEALYVQAYGESPKKKADRKIKEEKEAERKEIEARRELAAPFKGIRIEITGWKNSKKGRQDLGKYIEENGEFELGEKGIRQLGEQIKRK